MSLFYRKTKEKEKEKKKEGLREKSFCEKKKIA